MNQVTVKLPTLPLWLWGASAGLAGLLIAFYHYNDFWPTWTLASTLLLGGAVVWRFIKLVITL